MPRTRKYDINESIASSQATIISRVNDNNVHGCENHIGGSNPQKSNSFPLGWCVGVIFGALCLLFLLCVAFIKIPGVPTERVHSASRVMLNKQGYFKIYPTPSSERDDSFPKTKVISLSDMNKPIEQLRRELSVYPAYSDSYTTCFVSFPNFNHPCFFEKEWLGTTCTEENNFGYTEVNGMINPCILLRLDNLTDWQPLTYKRKDVDESWIDVYNPSFSNIECTILDKNNENKAKSLKIYPLKGLPNQFFPVNGFNRTLYLQPSVMLQINGLLVGQSVTIQCWLRVSNAFYLEDDGVIIISVASSNATNEISMSSSSSSSSSQLTQNNDSSMQQSTTEVIASETTTTRRLLSTTPLFDLGSDN